MTLVGLKPSSTPPLIQVSAGWVGPHRVAGPMRWRWHMSTSSKPLLSLSWVQTLSTSLGKTFDMYLKTSGATFAYHRQQENIRVDWSVNHEENFSRMTS